MNLTRDSTDSPALSRWKTAVASCSFRVRRMLNSSFCNRNSSANSLCCRFSWFCATMESLAYTHVDFAFLHLLHAGCAPSHLVFFWRHSLQAVKVFVTAGMDDESEVALAGAAAGGPGRGSRGRMLILSSRLWTTRKLLVFFFWASDTTTRMACTEA